MRIATSERRTCRHCRATIVVAASADRRHRWIEIYADPAPLTGVLALTRDAFGVLRWRGVEPGEQPGPTESLHLEHPKPCPKAQSARPALPQRPQRAAPVPIPPGVVSLDLARLRRAQRQRGT
uniref:hypothetical protein n=1 Tax=Nonomuraea sp. CA-251285 TaxID=3240002 RepID=UPI003F499A6A